MPRSATVQAVEDTDLLELGPEALAAIDDELTQVAPFLHKLASKRWLSNLIQHHPIFRVFESDSDRRELLQHFQALQIPRGTMLFAQGEVARGIYLVASGEVGLMHRDRPEGAPQLVQRVGPGSVPGIESLISDTPCPLSATALSPTTVLFLSRATYRRLASAVPELVEALRLLPALAESGEREASQVC
jgi:CRP-like cAMP-binding protein